MSGGGWGGFGGPQFGGFNQGYPGKIGLQSPGKFGSSMTFGRGFSEQAPQYAQDPRNPNQMNLTGFGGPPQPIRYNEGTPQYAQDPNNPNMLNLTGFGNNVSRSYPGADQSALTKGFGVGGASPANPTGSPDFHVGNLNINREAFRRMYGKDPSEVYGGQLNQQTGPGRFTDTGGGTFSYSGPIDQSFNNRAMGDQFTGVRPLVRDPARAPEMWQWVAGRPISLSNGNPALDQSEMTRQWGVGGTSQGLNPFVQNTNRWMG